MPSLQTAYENECFSLNCDAFESIYGRQEEGRKGEARQRSSDLFRSLSVLAKKRVRVHSFLIVREACLTV